MRIAVIVSGGTIASAGAPLAPVPAAEFAQACSSALGSAIAARIPGAEVEMVADLPFPNSPGGTLDSTNATPEDWCVIAARILRDYSGYDGWVVLHGTDTLQYTAAALAYLLSSFAADGSPAATLDKPVVMTGSQRPLFERATTGELALLQGSDATGNLIAAIAAAAGGAHGVAVAFGGHVFDGTRVVKVSTVDDEGFASPNAPELDATAWPRTRDAGRTGQPGLSDPRVLARARERLHHIASAIGGRPVLNLSAFPAAGASPAALPFLASSVRLAVAEGARGLVLESFGNGNFPSGHPSDPSRGAIAREVAAAVAAGVVCVNVSQVLRGGLVGAAYLSGSWMRDAGVISGGDMTASAALAKLTVLTAEVGWPGNDWGPGTVPALMATNLAGELTAPAVRAEGEVA